MRFIETASLSKISSFLDQVDVGESVVSGDLCLYSCVLAGLDKMLSRSLDEEIQSSSPRTPRNIGPLSSAASRRTLVYLILTLNHTYPDYDFSVLRAQHFRMEPSLSSIQETLETNLMEVSKVWEETPEFEKPLLETLWSSIDEVIDLVNCEIFSYKTDVDSDLFSDEGVLWSHNYFFHNKQRKKIVFFSCRGASKARRSGTLGYDSDDPSEIDYGMAQDMDV